MPPYGYSFSRRLVSQDDAAITERPDVPRSRFLNQWTRLTTFNGGDLVPFLVDPVYPGDHMKYDCQVYCRISTPLFPMFSSLRVDTFFFFIPYRLVWSNWTKFMGAQEDPSSSIAYTVPIIQQPLGGPAPNTLYDHMGLPTVGQINAGHSYAHNALFFRGYNMVYNQWFRDENITNTVYTTASDGPDNVTGYVLRKRAKSHDYFTSALPWPQKFTAPAILLSGQVPVKGIGFGAAAGPTGPANFFETQGVRQFAPDYVQLGAGGEFPVGQTVGFEADSVTGLPKVYADLSVATGVAINTFRQAFLVQQLLERDARGGTRYVELIKSHFGVTNPDFRLQRTEYIGGGQSPLNLTPIAQTAPTTGVPLGALGAAGTATGQHRASYAATEHGFILGLINVRSELAYQQGMHRMHNPSQTRYDYYFPSTAGLGEQAVLRKEIYMTGDPVNDNVVFGYQERWHELRTRYSEVTGMFKSTTTGTIDPWHAYQRFTAAPGLNDGFILDTPPLDRVLAAGASANNMQFLADILINRDATRPVPAFGTPVKLGRF